MGRLNICQIATALVVLSLSIPLSASTERSHEELLAPSRLVSQPVSDHAFDTPTTRLFAMSGPGQLGGISIGSGAPPVPEPRYATEKPWETVALLNPPKVRRKPVVSTPPPLPPPAVEAADETGGIPDWGKYAIAATGIAAIFVLFKR